MSTFAWMALFLIAISIEMPGIDPATQFEYGLAGARPPQCRPRSPYEQAAAKIAPTGKASTYHWRGEYVCERPVFEYLERDSFVDHVAAHLRATAERTAHEVAHRDDASTWHVEVNAPDDAIKHMVRNGFRAALVASLGPGRVLRRPSANSQALTVDVQLVDTEEGLFAIATTTAKDTPETGAGR